MPSTSTSVGTTTSTLPPTTSTSYGASTWTVPPTPTTDPNAFVINVIDFGADPTGVKDSAQAIQNAVDFAAHQVLLKDVAPSTMDPKRRALYQAYEDAYRATHGMPTVAVAGANNRLRLAIVIFGACLLALTILFVLFEKRRKP